MGHAFSIGLLEMPEFPSATTADPEDDREVEPMLAAVRSAPSARAVALGGLANNGFTLRFPMVERCRFEINVLEQQLRGPIVVIPASPAAIPIRFAP